MRSLVAVALLAHMPIGPHAASYWSPKPRLPPWAPTYNMQMSTIIMPCNTSGYHSVQEAIQWGIVDYDWSNAKQIWANAKPMTDEELLTKQAEMVLAADQKPNRTKVWVYRNSIKALNWYTAVREKLDDPSYAGWFTKFKDYKGPASNHSYHVPACTYEKCSGHYHDQHQTPQYPHGGSADGTCYDKCDCGKAPCGEYIFDFRNSSFSDWFINEYVISNETILHNGIFGFYFDDQMTLKGPTETDHNFVEDTGSSEQDMKDHVAAYEATMEKMFDKVVANGGFAWQLFGPDEAVPKVMGQSASQCASTLRALCKSDGGLNQYALRYRVKMSEAIEKGEQYTAQFLLTRPPYAWIGFGWNEEGGCHSSLFPRPAEWDVDYGEPSDVCKEMGTNAKVFTRDYSKASIKWDCTTGKGTIAMKTVELQI